MVDPSSHERQCGNPRCTKPVPPDPDTGRPRKYCSDPCKSAAYRDRQAARNWIPAVDPLELELPKPEPPIKQLALSVAELDTMASILLALSLELPPPLAWRAERTGLAIRRILEDNFQGVIR